MKVEIKDNTKAVLAELDRRLPIVLDALGIEAEGNAVSEINTLVYDTPQSPTYIRTGRLKGSIEHGHDADSAYIGTNVKYAPYVEFGTTKMDPRPFLRNAITNYVDDYQDIIEKGLSN